MVRELTRTATGWRLTIGSAADPEYLDADAVILATPAAPSRPAAEAVREPRRRPSSSRSRTRPWPSSRSPSGPGTSPHSSAAATWCPRWTAARSRPPPSPPSSGRTWRRRRIPGTRCTSSAARSAAAATSPSCSATTTTSPPSPPPNWRESIGITAQPVAHRVTRWGGGLPQYNVGHLDRVARIRQAVSEQPGLAVAGAAYDGVGIPACVATARRAADQVLNHLRATSPDGAEQRAVRPH